MIIGGRDFNDGHTHVMGILNVTPDSFSDGGKYNNIDAALLHTKEMIEDGAHIIDIGGESTRPGYTMISDEEEIERVCPVIEKIKNEFDIPVSIDTYKSRVASAAITSGADLINDIWGLKYDDDMAKSHLFQPLLPVQDCLVVLCTIETTLTIPILSKTSTRRC